MITFSRLGAWGRLGNQLHQYAALVGIGLALGYEIKIPPLNRHELGRCFEIPVAILTDRELRGIRRLFNEPKLVYSEEWRRIPDSCDLLGYFPSHRYIPPRRTLDEFLTFRNDVVENGRARVESLRARGRRVVGLAVRRGDYIGHPQFAQVLESDYYERAVALFADTDPIFAVTSDDFAWCRARFAGANFAVLDDLNQYEQLVALTLCDHMITTNSTFAWWAGWLNRSDDAVVVAPRGWFRDPPSRRDSRPILEARLTRRTAAAYRDANPKKGEIYWPEDVEPYPPNWTVI